MPSPVRYAVVKKVLEDKGYRLDHVTGSPHIFRKPGVSQQSIPAHHNQVKHVYYKKAQKAP